MSDEWTVERRWTTQAGLDGLVVRRDTPAFGSWPATVSRCGYVALPPEHPWHGIKTDGEVRERLRETLYGATIDDLGVIPFLLAAVSGDVVARTLAMQVNVHGGLTFAGHLKVDPDPWRIGFDCAHAGDSDDYWTEERVAEEVERLADQCFLVAQQAAMEVTP